MKFFTAIVALVAAAVVTVVDAQVIYADCDLGSDLTINTSSFYPYPLCVGQNVCVTGAGTSSAPVTAPSTLSIVGKYFGTHLHRLRGPPRPLGYCGTRLPCPTIRELHHRLRPDQVLCSHRRKLMKSNEAVV
ncbi:hypothetical protein BGZ80_000377 [Entomortierella chlamydospora]|uniref:Uncharacterized protein n=1 Tax=Entomortierella chlamydospora TaxID=101097 RepID=A0A9P6MTB7_9FUNG|nr:hypothetical protein BGZ80_000377 [Entomortierella chlamydospora]